MKEHIICITEILELSYLTMKEDIQFHIFFRESGSHVSLFSLSVQNITELESTVENFVSSIMF